ncbi:MAG: hypothetical protein LBU68_00645, partial [Rickettsiales bacterium]|nr:hypothetical protein [Rickettsiales bacterium]
AYKNTANPEYRNVHNLIDEYFQATYPGNVEYDETGRMLDVEAKQNYDGGTEYGGDYDESDGEEMVTVWVAGGGCDHCADMVGAIIEPGEAQCPHPNCKCSEDTMTMSEYEAEYGREPKNTKSQQKFIDDMKRQVREYEQEYHVNLREEKRERMEKIEQENKTQITQESLDKMAQEVSDALKGAISPEGVRALMQEEGSKAYIHNDGKNNDSIGIGHKIVSGENFDGKILDYNDQKNLLIADLKSPVQSAKNISEQVKGGLNQAQKDAIASHVFNRGGGNWADSDLYDSLQNNNLSNLKKDFLQNSIHQPANVKPGLTNRYTNEYNMFNNGIYRKGKVKIE